MLDVLDKLGSVLSAVFALVGLVLTVVGLRQARRRDGGKSSTAPESAYPAVPPPSDLTRGRADTRPDLVVPPPSAWVPESKHLPRQPQPSGPFYQDSFGDSSGFRGDRRRPAPATAAGPPRRTLLWAGIALLVLGAVFGVVSVLL